MAFYHVFQGDEQLAVLEPEILSLHVEGLTSLSTYSSRCERRMIRVTNRNQTLEVTTTDGDPPVWPDADLAIVLDNEVDVTLSWSEASDAKEVTGYRVYRDGELVAQTATTQVSFEGLTAKTTFLFTVQAGDAAGNWSTDGPTGTVTTGNPCVPPLAFSETESYVPAYGWLTLEATGGTDPISSSKRRLFQAPNLIPRQELLLGRARA